MGRGRVTDEQLRAAFPAWSLGEIAVAGVRVAHEVEAEGRRPEPETLEEVVDAPSVRGDEAEACGAVGDLFAGIAATVAERRISGR